MEFSNRLFVAKKPIFTSSNTFLGRIKRQYGVKKAGFSGTLDPFATGVLIIAFNQYTKLFRFLKKTPKTYRATLWLGACSDTLDIEGIHTIENTPPFESEHIEAILNEFVGAFTYTPPLYSAKKIDGKRAYSLARKGEKSTLEPCTSTIHSIRLLHYRHPFVTFEANVSEGTYIRSLADAIANKLGVPGALSYLERIKEGLFVYDDEKALDPRTYLSPEANRYLGSVDDLKMGKKLDIKDFEKQVAGIYTLSFEPYFAIIEIDKSGKVHYLLNKVKLCSY